MNTGNSMSVSTAIFYGNVKKKRTEPSADESEEKIGFSDHENDVDWMVYESSDGDISGKLAQTQTRHV